MRIVLCLLLFTGLTATSFAQTATDYFNAGKKDQENKDIKSAIENFKKATTQKPDYGEAWYELGWSYNDAEQYNDAITALSQAKKLLPEAPKVYYELGYAYDYSAKYPLAIQNYNKAIELKPDYSGAYRQVANIQYDIDKNYKDALENYKTYISYAAEEDVTAKTWYKMGYCENEALLYNEAITYLKKAISADAQYASAYDEIGYAYYKLEMADETIEAYNKSKDLNPKSSTPYTGLGDVYRFLVKNTDEAIPNYQKGIELNPESQNSNYGLGWCYNDKGNYSAALPYLKKTVQLNSNYTAAIIELGYSYYALKQYDDALEQFRKALSISSNSDLALYYSGLCYVAKNDKAKATDMYNKLNGMSSKNAAALLDYINKMN